MQLEPVDGFLGSAAIVARILQVAYLAFSHMLLHAYVHASAAGMHSKLRQSEDPVFCVGHLRLGCFEQLPI